MASKLPVWGIDVGQCSLKALKLQDSGGRVELLGFDVVDHEQILSQAEADSEMVTQAIETFASRNDLSNSRIVVSVPGQQTLTRFTKMPPVDAKKIPDMVQYEASQQIPFDMDEVVWDYQVFADGEATEVEVGIFAIRKELIRGYLSHFTESGIEPFIVQTSPMASYNTARFEIPLVAEEAAILLDMGALATDLIVMEGNRIWSRPIPIGGNHFTEKLVSAFKIPFKKAERLKRNAEKSKYARQIFQAMRPVFADLVAEVQRSIGYYTSTHRDADISRVICMGNAFKLPGLQKFLQQNLQIKVDKLGGFKKLEATQVEKQAEFDENLMSLTVAYGLALQGLGTASVDSNLLPMEVRRTLLWRKKRPWFVASAACLALASASIWVSNVSAVGKLKDGRGNTPPEAISRPKNYATPKSAMDALRSSGGSPVERAQAVLGAATKLETEYRSVDKPSPDEATLKRLAKFPENNVYIPRIIDVIHQAFDETTSPELKGVKNAEEYKRLAGNTKRENRKEIWIEELLMDYSSKPEERLPSKASNRSKSSRKKPGWAMLIRGITTEQEPATWLQENLIETMLRLGRRPDRGIYFDSVKVEKVSVRGKPKKKGKRTTKARDDGRGRGGRGARVGGRGRGEESPGGRGGLPIYTGGWGQPESPRSGGQSDLDKWKKKLRSADPLTGEEVEKDYRFELHIIIRKDDTPKDLIPDIYKEKENDKKDEKSAGRD